MDASTGTATNDLVLNPMREEFGHASIKTTGHVYVQTIEQSVLAALNSRTSAVLGEWRTPEEDLGLKGRNLKGPNVIL
jgi:hypothetical protein